MKINDKHLAMFAGGTAVVDRQGYLNKRGEVNKSFQRRWFVLKGNLLFYYDKRSDVEPIGVIILEGCSIELIENSEKFAFELVFLGSGARTYVLAADSQEDMESWMKDLACSGHDYMRCAIMELQRQLDELNIAAREQATNDIANNTCAVTSNEKRASPSIGNVVIKGQTKRANPFDRLKENDHFDLSQEVRPQSENSSAKRSARTFEQMHLDFGEYICIRTSELEHTEKKISS
jgi:sesquipedalian